MHVFPAALDADYLPGVRLNDRIGFGTAYLPEVQNSHVQQLSELLLVSSLKSGQTPTPITLTAMSTRRGFAPNEEVSYFL